MISHFTNGSFGVKENDQNYLVDTKGIELETLREDPNRTIYARYAGKYDMNGHTQGSPVKMVDLQEYPKQIPTVFLLALHGEDQWCESQ